MIRLGRSKHAGDLIALFGGPKVDDHRNAIVYYFLQGTDDYLLMVDTDMYPPPDTIDRLVAHDKDIVGGLCFTSTLGRAVRPTLHVIREDSEGNPYFDILWDYPKNSLIQVDATGTGCMLIRRNVLEEVWEARGKDHPMPWFAFGMHRGVPIGEDTGFCITAMKCGFSTWVDTSVVVPHMKTYSVGEEEYAVSLSREDHPRYTHRETIPTFTEYRDDWIRRNRPSVPEAETEHPVHPTERSSDDG